MPIHCASAQSLPLASSPEQEEIQNRGSTVTAPSLVECGLSAGSSGPECPAKTLGAREGEESSRVSWLGCPLYPFPNTSCLPPHTRGSHTPLPALCLIPQVLAQVRPPASVGISSSSEEGTRLKSPTSPPMRVVAGWHLRHLRWRQLAHQLCPGIMPAYRSNSRLSAGEVTPVLL